jgi:hypothetical protein
MKESFLIGMVALVVIAGGGYFIWLAARSFHSMYSDWNLGKELDVIRTESDARRKQKGEENQRRLDNGCEHVFDQGFGEFPPGVCRKCGLERERPKGTCDHVWRRAVGAVPGSYCEKCEKKYGG